MKSMKKIFSNDYLRLFIRRESRVVVGNRCVNLWVLTAMLVLTFLAIAFSNASLSYLKQRMDDPFTNWVNIPIYGQKLNELENDFGKATSELRNKYGIAHFSVDNSTHYVFYGNTLDKKPYLGCLFFESIENNPLIDAILDPSNVVDNCCIEKSLLTNDLLGLIITQDKMESMGYLDPSTYPSFVNFRQFTDASAAIKYDLQLQDSKFSSIAIPVLAVVKKLPMNMDVVASANFFNQQQSRVFNLNDSVANSKLIYAVEDSTLAQEIDNFLYEQVDDNVHVGQGYIHMPQYTTTFRENVIVSVQSVGEYTIPCSKLNELDRKVRERFLDGGYVRLYHHTFVNADYVHGNTFVSMQLTSDGLKNIRAFAEYLNEEYNVDIEMAQIQSKENFSAVSVTATILTWTIIFFALVSVILFIVNLLRTYFQRVKRNMGTFKAFGMSNRELIGIYILILIAIVSGAIIISLLAVVIIQLLLAICHLSYQGGSPYLLLGNINTLFAILVILASSVLTVYWVMKNQLSATPGDLIYDR